MSRGLSRSLLVPLVVALVAIGVQAAGPNNTTATTRIPILERYLALGDPDPVQFRVLRHIDAQSERLGMSAWMDVWTDADRGSFHYRIVGEGGSDYIRTKVFRASLETERRMWAEGTPARAALTPNNYV